MSDTFILKGLQTRCIIGDYEWERKRPQKILLDIEVTADCSGAVESDSLEAGGLDYNRLAKEILQFVEKSGFRLIETLADRVAAMALKKFPAVETIKVRLAKPSAIKAAEAAIVEVERRR